MRLKRLERTERWFLSSFMTHKFQPCIKYISERALYCELVKAGNVALWVEYSIPQWHWLLIHTEFLSHPL